MISLVAPGRGLLEGAPVGLGEALTWLPHMDTRTAAAAGHRHCSQVIDLQPGSLQIILAILSTETILHQAELGFRIIGIIQSIQ